MGAGVNAIRTQTLIRDADVVVVRFGDKYRQWNAAFDAGYAAALGKPIVTLHDAELDHALKEVDRAAQGTARTAEQVVDVLRYVIRGKLPAAERRRAGRMPATANRALIERFYAAFGRVQRRRDDRLLRARTPISATRPSATSRARTSARCGGC